MIIVNLVYMFYSSRCGPCKQIAPKFVELSKKYPAACFWKVDVDICRVSKTMFIFLAICLLNTTLFQSTAMRYEVRAMPTFVIFKNRENIHQVHVCIHHVCDACIFYHISNNYL